MRRRWGANVRASYLVAAAAFAAILAFASVSGAVLIPRGQLSEVGFAAGVCAIALWTLAVQWGAKRLFRHWRRR